MKAFRNALVYTEGELKTCNLLFDERVRAVGEELAGEVLPLPAGALVLPGFLDEHIHGAGGADVMDGTVEALARIAQTLVREGTTSFLATTMTQSPQAIERALRAVDEYAGAPRGARLLGAHLEGPFIASAYRGAQPEEYLQRPSLERFEAYDRAGGGKIRIVTLAPEIEGAEALIGALKERGILVSIGHTAADFRTVEGAARLGASHVTHTYNAMTPLHHREAGAVGGALLLNELSCELIADGIHVSEPAMRLLAANKAREKLILITDSIRAKGLGDCVSELGGQTVYVKDGSARLSDGTLAGSVLRMNEAVRNLVRAGVSLPAAVDAASLNPARDLGLDEKIGRIRPGGYADFAVLDREFNVLMTIVGGEVVYRAEET